MRGSDCVSDLRCEQVRGQRPTLLRAQHQDHVSGPSVRGAFRDRWLLCNRKQRCCCGFYFLSHGSRPHLSLCVCLQLCAAGPPPHTHRKLYLSV